VEQAPQVTEDRVTEGTDETRTCKHCWVHCPKRPSNEDRECKHCWEHCPSGRYSATSPTALELLPSFRRHLAAENKAPRTAQAYTEGVTRLHEYLVAQGMPTEVDKITREYVEGFLADQVTRLKASSARSRYASIRQFFRWLVEEGEIGESPLARMRPPAVPETPVPILTEDELRALLKAPAKDASFYGRRDEAVLRVFVDTGARLAEVAGLRVEDLDLDSGTVALLGKGRRVRYAPIGSKTVRALDRYLRLRSRHPDSMHPALWLGRAGPMTAFGLDELVKRRAKQAGVGHVHVHQLRHSAAHFLRLAGADDDSVMRLMGWRDRAMLHRYGSSAADERARATHRRLGLGDRL
jgi:site-specific recombinase XerD